MFSKASRLEEGVVGVQKHIYTASDIVDIRLRDLESESRSGNPQALRFPNQKKAFVKNGAMAEKKQFEFKVVMQAVGEKRSYYSRAQLSKEWFSEEELCALSTDLPDLVRRYVQNLKVLSKDPYNGYLGSKC